MQSKRGWVSLSKRWRVIQQECNKFFATYESIKARPVFQALEAFKVQHDGKAYHLSHWWTVINGEEKLKAQYAALLTCGGKKMCRTMDLREEKLRQEKEEQMHAFMEIQRRRFKMDAERQAKMLELEEAKQAKILEIEATNARTNAKEVALASMKTRAKIMKVDRNTVSPRKRL
ncbi:Lectin-domain containing receptor kinase A4.3 [Hordeum vulgare]|nr:Lectin-domain containing receptor kinase A4.3 [Hordeum vulgare]